MACSITDVAAPKSCVLLNILALKRFQDSSIVTVCFETSQIYFSCSVEKWDNMTLTISPKKKETAGKNNKIVQNFSRSSASSVGILMCCYLTS